MEFIQEGDRSKWKAHSNHSIKCFTEGDIDRMTNNYQLVLEEVPSEKYTKGFLRTEAWLQ